MASVVSQPNFIFGLRTGVMNNLCFVDEQTVAYPSGNSCVCHNFVQRCQRFISSSENSQSMCALAISPDHRYLAVSEKAERASICVFDLHQEQDENRKLLTAQDMAAQQVLCLAFSPDSKYVVGQTGSPEWMLRLWFWEKNKVLATMKTTTSDNPVTQVSFNPYNSMQLCVSGTGVLKLLHYSKGALKQKSKVDSFNFLCHTWMSEKMLIAGTDTGRLLVFESGEVRKEIKMTSKSGRGQTNRRAEVTRIKDSDVTEGLTASRITAILSCSRGFLCTTGPGTVCLFEDTDMGAYMKSREIQIPSDPCSPGEYQEIDTLCISPQEETLAISTDRGQLYSISLSAVHVSKEEHVNFEFLSQPFHSNCITGLSICIRKPIVATGSLDRSVRIWNYETREMELYKEFQEEVYSVALHPTGIFILVGFTNKLRLMNLVFDDIRTFKEFMVHSCTECAFSHGGHMFAAVSGNVIDVYSFTTLENIHSLKAHSGKVQSIEWSLDDSRLVSCGLDGAVYEWNTKSGNQESENILKSCSYTDVAFSSDYKTILAVGTDSILREIQDCQVLREVPADEVAHTTLAISHSGRVVFTGTSSGTIRAVKYPLPIQKEWITRQAHCGPVTKMVVTFDDQFLLTVSEDGCLLISKIIDTKGRGLKSNRQIVHTEEILVSKADLYEKKRIQEEYEKLLTFTDERRIQAVEELTQMYELKLQEKTQLLIQCQEEAKREISVFEEILKQTEEDKEKKIHALRIKYEKQLLSENENSTDFKEKTRIMTQKLYSLQRQNDDMCSNINKLNQEQQSLQGLIRSLRSEIEDLTSQITGHKMSNQYQQNIISGLNKKNQELENLKCLYEFQLSDLQKKINCQHEDIKKKGEQIHQLEEELEKMEESNSQMKLTISDLRLKLKSKDREMHLEMQKMKDLETLIKRMKSDLHGCVGFIQEPNKLKESVKMIYARYAPNADSVGKKAADDDEIQTLRVQCEHLEKTVTILKKKLEKSAKQLEQAEVKNVKENMSLVAEINLLIKELHLARTEAKDYKAQLAVRKPTNKCSSSRRTRGADT